MELTRVITKKRSEFGKPCKFVEQAAEVVISLEQDNDGRFSAETFFLNSSAQKNPEYSEHEVNTEGGWPKDVSIDDIDQIKRYRKKIEKDENFVMSQFRLARRIEDCVRQHIAVDIFEKEIFPPCPKPTHSSTTSDGKMKTVAVIKDFGGFNRQTSCISWNFGDPNKIAIGFKNNQSSANQNTIFIVDIEKISKPVCEVSTSKNVDCMSFNPKDSSQLLIGFEDGFFLLFDVRKATSLASKLIHSGPVTSVLWL